MVSLAVTVLLSLINIGSTVGLLAIISLALTSLMSSYIISISCIVIKRLRGEPLPRRRWSLGKFGLPINIASLIFLMPLFVFSFFPLVTPVDTTTMNWSIVMYVAVIGFATGYYILYGRHKFIPPVALVKRDMN